MLVFFLIDIEMSNSKSIPLFNLGLLLHISGYPIKIVAILAF